MSDEEVEVGEESEEGSSGKPMLKWIIIAVIVLLIVGGGIVGWMMIQKGTKDKADRPTPAPEVKFDQASSFGNILPLEPFVVNLADPGGKRYLKTKIELELAAGTLQDELSTRMPQLRDTILLQLSSKTMEDIQNIDGKIALRNELIMRINQILTKGKIRNLYFTEFVVQ